MNGACTSAEIKLQSEKQPDQEKPTMKKLTIFAPLFTRFSAALLLSVAMASPPAIAGGRGGPAICQSQTPGVSTHFTTPVKKKCSGCLTSVRFGADYMDFAAIDFRQPGQDIELTVAVLPNDSRLLDKTPMKPTRATGPGKSKVDGKFRYMPGGAWHENWHRFRFTNLIKDRYYAVVIYNGMNYRNPFYRYCFLKK